MCRCDSATLYEFLSNHDFDSVTDTIDDVCLVYTADAGVAAGAPAGRVDHGHGESNQQQALHLQ